MRLERTSLAFSAGLISGSISGSISDLMSRADDLAAASSASDASVTNALACSVPGFGGQRLFDSSKPGNALIQRLEKLSN
jgi:hypothetical protein